MEGQTMSIVRIGLGETKNFAEGYDAIFGKKDKKDVEAAEKPPADEKATEEKKDKKKKK
jgi:hypothetical protein